MRIVFALLLSVLSAGLTSRAAAEPYLGLFLGYADANDAWEPTAPGDPLLSPEGIMFGGFAGYLFDVPGVVLGLEADVTFPALDDSAECGPTTDCSVDVKVLGAIRGRAGVTLGPIVLYGTGGPAFGFIQAESNAPGESSDSTALAGWTLGAGVEYRSPTGVALGFEYRHSDYGSAGISLGGTSGDVNLETDEVRARLSIALD